MSINNKFEYTHQIIERDLVKLNKKQRKKKSIKKLQKERINLKRAIKKMLDAYEINMRTAIYGSVFKKGE